MFSTILSIELFPFFLFSSYNQEPLFDMYIYDNDMNVSNEQHSHVIITRYLYLILPFFTSRLKAISFLDIKQKWFYKSLAALGICLLKTNLLKQCNVNEEQKSGKHFFPPSRIGFVAVFVASIIPRCHHRWYRGQYVNVKLKN